ncbi:MAG: hypothetical protein H7A45_06205 [Verrucomicrobiales bacterium]|nr:hypothetical protein [Verrucomicrobiales bacterium]MCP5528121.1 hypothetical protein [Verrucomicrobiales bacterium]
MKKSTPSPTPLATRALRAWLLVVAGIAPLLAAQDGGQPPTVTLALVSDAPLVAPATIQLVAQVEDTDGWVRQVEFYANDRRIAVVEGDSRAMGPMSRFQYGWRHVLAGDYLLEARAVDETGQMGSSEPVKLHIEQADEAFVVIQHPLPEARFTAPDEIVIEATAVDPQADIRLVEFYANQTLIGRSEFLSRMAIIPGNPISHRLVWEGALPGDHVLQGVAYDVNGNRVRSNEVAITVVSENYEPVVVAIRAVKAEATEGAAGLAGQLRFLVHRRGHLDLPITVFYLVGGSASMGKDYATLSGEILIPAGREQVEILVTSLTDSIPEDPEAITLQVVPPPCIKIHPPPPECYQVASQDLAEGVIIDPEQPPQEGWVLLPSNATWRYSNAGEPAPDDWAEADFDDRDWPAGPAQLGYGDGDEATVTREAGPPHPMTAYFRAGFAVPADVGFKGLVVRLVRDDGAAVYLNGVPLLRDNLPDGPLDFETPSAGNAGEPENGWHRFELPADALRTGENVLAVEVHQRSPESSDLSFALELVALPDLVPETELVSLKVEQAETMEPGPEFRVIPGRMRLARTGDIAHPLEVFCTFTGSATQGIDYVLDPAPDSPFRFTIPAGAEGVTIFVHPLDDALPEGDETVVAELVPLAAGAASAPPFGGYRIDPEHDRARIVIHDNDASELASTLVITNPPEGAGFPSGEAIPIHITAIDPYGYLPMVEVFAGEQSIGTSRIEFLVAPPDGQPIEHAVEWQDAPGGRHVVTARAVTSAGEKVVSEPVTVFVEPLFEPVVLSVFAEWGATAEPGPLVDPAPAAFVVTRVAGPLNIEVPIQFAVGGNASPGEDFLPIPAELTLPAGESSLRVPVIALADNLPEGTEHVVFELFWPACPEIFPPPAWCYQLGDRTRATITIHDSPPHGVAPRVAIVRPRQGAVVLQGEPVEIVAEAGDPDGEIVNLRVWANGELLAETGQSRISTEWTPAESGTATLRAEADDDTGLTGASQEVVVFVRPAAEFSFVRRALPAAYVPGEGFAVQLDAVPPTDGIAWAVEEVPPAGWMIAEVSDGGGFDAVTAKVKFGPFTDGEPRRLSYRITPGDDASGRYEFRGWASLDGSRLPVGGDRLLTLVLDNLPADLAPADMLMTMDEVTAYVAAWRQGREWPLGPQPIPLAFVARAGALWQGGERYVYDPTLGQPPMCWVNLPPPSDGVPQGLPVEAADGSAQRALPEQCAPGQEFTVSVRIDPPSETRAWAVEEVIPQGWEILAVSHEGRFDPATRCIRWGLFLGAAVKELGYHAVAPAGVASWGTFRGQASFDGTLRPLGGGQETVSTDAATAVRFTRVERSGKGPLRLRIEGAAGQLIRVEASKDLRCWTEIAPVGLVNGELVFEDDAPADGNACFYRARPIGP